MTTLLLVDSTTEDEEKLLNEDDSAELVVVSIEELEVLEQPVLLGIDVLLVSTISTVDSLAMDDELVGRRLLDIPSMQERS